MSAFTFTSPDGKSYTVNGPAGATQEEAYGVLQKQLSSGQATPDAPKAASAGDWAKGAGETLLQFGTGALAQPIAGLAGILKAGGNALGISDGADAADTVRSVQSALTYQPTSDAGQKISGVTGYLPQKFAQGADWAGGKFADITGSPLAGAALNTAIQAAPLALGAKFLPGKATATAATVAPEVADATALGLKLTPEQAQSGFVGRALQSLTNGAKLERNFSRANAPTVNALVGKDIGINSGPVNAATVAAQKIAPNAVYDAAANSGTIQLDPTFQATVGKPLASGTLKNQAVIDLQDHYAGLKDMDSADLVADVRQLRADANKNIAAPFAPAQNSLGYAQKHVAAALDAQLERHLQSIQSPIAGQLPGARVRLAQIHTVQDALDGPNVSAKYLGKQLEKGAPLSGNMLKIAQAHANFSRSLQDVSALRNSGPFSALDPLFGLGALAGHPAALAGVVAPPLVRSALGSAPYQRFAIQGVRTAPYSPGLLGAGKVTPLLTRQGLLSQDQ